ncbi:MAG TPA: hypothetical protein VFV05_18870 [Methylomirabilota bacterium]|nr:hypothetical protein [Methylomirabilota bacterium]
MVRATIWPFRVEGDAVALDPTAVEVDVEAFERGIAEGTAAALAAAVPLYRGDLLAGLSVEGRVQTTDDDHYARSRRRLASRV